MEQLEDGDPDDLYMWVTDAPDSILPQNPNHVRINTYFGINKIGSMSKRPPASGPNDPENRGVFLHVLTQTDVKAGKWMNKVLTNVAASSAVDFGANLRKYASANMEKLKRHVQDQQILFQSIEKMD